MCPLHYTAFSGFFSMVEMLLHHGARTDMRSNISSLRRIGYNNLALVYESKLPLESILLKHGEDSYLRDWSPNESISYLLFLLCLPAQKDLFDIIRLLTLNTEEVEETICHCALEGKIVEFALLLLAAPEKVMAPFMIRSTEDSDSNASMAIHQCIMHAIAKQAEEEVQIFNCKSIQLPLKFRNVEVLKYELKLLHVFEIVGNAFDKYIQSDRILQRKEKLKLAKEITMLVPTAVSDFENCTIVDAVESIETLEGRPIYCTEKDLAGYLRAFYCKNVVLKPCHKYDRKGNDIGDGSDEYVHIEWAAIIPYIPDFDCQLQFWFVW